MRRTGSPFRQSLAKGFKIAVTWNRKKNFFKNRRLKIIHFTVIDESKYECFLKKLVQFIWDTDVSCVEVRILLQVIYISKNLSSFYKLIIIYHNNNLYFNLKN